MADETGILPDDGSIPNNIIVVQGPAGPAGEPGDVGTQQGPIGPAGPAGIQGDRGPQGEKGPIGPAGPAGSAGAQGFAGPQGLVGVQGDKGSIGPAGVTGDKGPNGIGGGQGPVGPQGPVGDKGPRGSAGAQGPVGVRGPQGSDGLKGLTGPTGPRGPTGDKGPKGGSNAPLYKFAFSNATITVKYRVAEYTTSRGTVTGFVAVVDSPNYTLNTYYNYVASGTTTTAAGRKASYEDPTNPARDTTAVSIPFLWGERSSIVESDKTTSSGARTITYSRMVMNSIMLMGQADNIRSFIMTPDFGLDTSGNIAYLQNSVNGYGTSRSLTAAGSGGQTTTIYYYGWMDADIWLTGDHLNWPDDSEAVGLTTGAYHSRVDTIRVYIGGNEMTYANTSALNYYRTTVSPY